MDGDNRKLDNFRPDYETLQRIKRIIAESGIPPDTIDTEWVEAAIAATFKWQSKTHEGMKFTVNLLNFQWTRGLDEKKYHFTDNNGVLHAIPSDKVFFFAGASIKTDWGTFMVHPNSITIDKKETTNCDCCGSSVHCVTTVRDPSTDRLDSLCNGCIIRHESMRVRDQGRTDLCYSCSRKTCHFNSNYTPLLTGT